MSRRCIASSSTRRCDKVARAGFASTPAGHNLQHIIIGSVWRDRIFREVMRFKNRHPVPPERQKHACRRFDVGNQRPEDGC